MKLDEHVVEAAMKDSAEAGEAMIEAQQLDCRPEADLMAISW